MRRSGYTLLEVTLVVALLAILAAISLPSIEGSFVEIRQRAGSDAVRGYWAEARTRAIEDFRPYRFAVKPGTGHFRIAPHSESDAGTDPMEGDEGGDTARPLSVDEELPKGVSFAEGDGTGGESDGDGYVTLVVFRTDGTADRDVEVVFQADGCRPLQLRLRGLTGAVTTKKLKMGEGQ